MTPVTASGAPLPGAAVVLDAGPAAILVDEGRPGWAHIGVTKSGAFDRQAYRLANRLVGNVPGVAAVEFVFGPVSVAFHQQATIAVTGVDADVLLTGPGGSTSQRNSHSTIPVAPHTTVSIGAARTGLRGYLAVRGGWDVPALMGSRCTDTLAELGPAPLQPQDFLPIGAGTEPFPSASYAPHPAPGASLELRLLPAPRAELLLLPRSVLGALAWTVSSASSRIGVRLDGPELPVVAQVASEPLVRGAVQIPPDGQPMIMGPDHPTTGGYPVVGVVADADIDGLAQARPGTTVRLLAVPGA